MDRNHNWINDPKQRYSNTELLDIDTFVNRDSRINAEVEEISPVNYQTLNDNQK